MLHAFNIYPALFVLTPVESGDTNQLDQRNNEQSWIAETDSYFTSCPHTYWGDCVITSNTKQLMVACRNDAQPCPVQEKIDGKLNVLEPAKFKGQHYTVTYIPVLN